MDQYEVGQILYTTSKSSFKIIPIQVVEEVIRTTINGTEKTYMVCFPDGKKTIVDIKKVKGEIFKTTESVENFLLENTKTAIKELVKEANIIKSEAFGKVKVISNKSNIEKESVQQNNSGDIIKVDLGNGQVGRINKSQINKPGE